MKKKMKINIKVILIVIIVFVLGIVVLNKNSNKEDTTEHVEKNNTQTNVVKLMQVTSENFETEVLKSDKTVVVEFYANWCEPCKEYEPILEALATENTDIKVVKVNVDTSNDIATKYKIISIPTTVVIKNGEEVNRVVGMMKKEHILEMTK